MNNTKIRYACREDVPLILNFIRELAAYEKMSDLVVADEDLLGEWIFDRQKAEVLFAMEDGKEVGFALFFHNFSTFLGRAGIYLEDLFVLPSYRGHGHDWNRDDGNRAGAGDAEDAGQTQSRHARRSGCH